MATIQGELLFIFFGLVLFVRSSGQLIQAPEFETDFPSKFEFSNSTGGQIPCSVRGYPKPKVSWIFADGTLVSNNAQGLRQVTTEGTLVFPPFKAEDYRQDVHSVQYRCQATNSLGTIVSNKIQMKGIVLQPFDVHVYDVYAMKGNSVVMKCHKPEFLENYISVTSWIKDSVMLISSSKMYSDSKYLFLPNGDLYIRNVSSDDAMTSFRCQALQRLTGETKASVSSGRLIVTEPEANIPPKITSSGTAVTVEEGQILFLLCIVQGNPAPTCSWSRQNSNGQVTNVELTDRVYQISGSLLIENSRSDDSGIYICSASNLIGSDKKAIEVNIAAPLNVRLLPRDSTVDIDQSIALKCQASGTPIMSLVWLKDGQPIANELKAFASNNDTLTIAKMTPELAGIYQCFAVNSFHSVFATAVLRLGDTIPEIMKTFDENFLQPGDNAILECSAKGNPSPDVYWMVDNLNVSLRTHNVRMEKSVDAGDEIVSKLILTNVNREDGGVYRCVAKNKAGETHHQKRINVYGKIEVKHNTKTYVTAESVAFLNCPYYGYPVNSVSWEKDGEQLPINLWQRVFQNGSLKITDVQRRKDNGQYTCIVKSSDGSSARGDVELIVMVLPKITPFSFQEELIREGSRARIQCVVSDGESPLKITWVKDGLPISSELGVTIRDVDEFSSILMISAITPRHNGNYTCVVANAAGQTSHTAPLFVNVVPRIIPFAFREAILVGSLARITCVVDQGDLPISIQWLKEGHLLISGDGVLTRVIDDYSSILTIEKVNLNNAGTYTCRAANAAATVNHSTTLIIHVPPKLVPFSFPEESLLQGTLVRVSCVVSRGDLPLIITWRKDGQSLSKDMSIKTRDFDEYSSVLSIDPLLASHSGEYTCVAKNAAGTASYTATLLVKVPPEWVIAPTDISTRLGQELLIHCKAKGFPDPTIIWKKVIGTNLDSDTLEILRSSEHHHILRNGSLLLKNIRKNDAGYYYCIASNEVGRPLSRKISVKINAAPDFETSARTLTVKKGESVKIHCKATGDTPITYEWTVDNYTINSSLKSQRYKVMNNVRNEEYSSDLSISWVDKKDSVNFTCRAKNTIGQTEMIIRIIVQETPEAPNMENVKVMDQNVELHWSKPYDGNSPIQKYYVQYKLSFELWDNVEKTTMVATDRNTTYIHRLLPATLYNVRVMAENRIGNSSFSEEVNVKTEESIPTGAPQNVQVESTDTTTLRVTWKPPLKETWNGAVRGYNVGYKIKDYLGDYTYEKLDVPEDYTEDLIYQLANLQMYTQYEIIVQACNSKGTGPSSETVLAMTSEGLPSEAPGQIRCSTLSAKSIYILWDPPHPDTTNGILRGYKVLYKPAKEWYDALQQSKIVNVPKITLQELEVNTNYSVEVLAFTKAGDGKKSEPVFCKTHEDVPDPPSQIKVLPASSDSVLVSWKPSNKSRGANMQYNVYFRPLEEGKELVQQTEQLPGKDTAVQESQGDNQFLEISGLKKNHKYMFWVTATNALGESPMSPVSAQTVADNIVPAKSASFDEVIKTPWKQDVVMPCDAVGIPPPQKKWTVGNDPVSENGHLVFRSDGALIISKATNEDSGNYTCAVFNEHGRDNVQYAVMVQIPPAAPKMSVISKTKNSIQLQWKPGPHGGEPIRGFLLHYKREREEWIKKELRPEHGLYNLENLACGTTYQIYMQAFSSIGTGIACETITVATDGAESEPPKKEVLIREGSAFATVHLDAWPSTGCPVEHFGIEYKQLTDTKNQWIVVGSKVSPLQKKLLISGLTPATRYLLRVHVASSSGSSVLEYRFVTHTTTGATVSPDMIEDVKPVYIFYLDPLIFVPAVALLVVIIIASAIVCVVVKRRSGSVRAPSDLSLETNQMNTWIRNSKMMPPDYGYAYRSSTLSSRRTSKDPTPYATTHMLEYYPELAANYTMKEPHPATENVGTLRRGQGADKYPDWTSNTLRRQPGVNEMQESTFVFPSGSNANPAEIPINGRPNDDYDPPPKAHMMGNFVTIQDHNNDNAQLIFK